MLFIASTAMAVDADTLPKGVRMTQARFGAISGLDQTWRSDGKLYDLGETRSVSFDAATLAKVNERARALIEALDYFGSGSLGDKIHLGTLKVSTKPDVTFMAPIFAYGLTDRWSVGFGVPIVHYKNQLSLSASGSNLAFYRSQFQGINQRLDEALKIDLVTEAQKVIAEKGYRKLESREETFVGDIQFAVLHRFAEFGPWAFMHQAGLSLPTGPRDDPDDLMALNSFGRTSLENTLVAACALSRQWAVVPYASVLLPFPDRVIKRVPKDEDDTLPDASHKQELGRTTGASASAGAELHWAFTSRWEAKTGAEATEKASDHYEGSGRTDLLEKNSDSSVVRVRGGLTYQTVEDYRRKRALLPSKVLIEVSDTIYGRNIERQLRTELAAMIFF